ncbi:hypothetical protein PHLGIDRAFT_66103, partial [Phlebiopsis gigantea 11061_1 CR5-6]
LGYSLNWALYGALTIQIYIYHISFPRDQLRAKGALYLLWAIETTQTILVTNDAFNAFVRSFGMPSELNEIQTEWLAGPIFSAVVSCAVQLYYGYRLGMLSESFCLQGVVSVVSDSSTHPIVMSTQGMDRSHFYKVSQESTVE